MSKLIDITAAIMMASVSVYFAIATIISIDKNYWRPDECQQQIDLIRYMG